MTIYYIDPTAQNNGDGLSYASPFNTWDSVPWNYGNQYLQKAGTTWNQKITIAPPAAAVNKEDGVIVGAYGGIYPTANEPTIINKPKIDGAAGNGFYVNVSGTYGQVSYVTIQDFEIFNITGVASSNGGICLYSASGLGHNKVKRCYIHDCDRNGIYCAKPGVDLIQDCVIENTGYDAIYCMADDTYTYGIDIINCNVNYPSLIDVDGDCIQVGDGSFLYVNITGCKFKTHGTVKQCVIVAASCEVNITDCEFDGESIGRSGFSCPLATTLNVSRCVFKNFILSTANALNVYDNTAEAAKYTGPVTTNIKDCLFDNCARAIGCSGTGAHTINIYNNTMLSNCGAAMRLYGNHTVTAKNNILDGVGTVAEGLIYIQSTIAGFTEDANIFPNEFTGMIKDYRAGINTTFNTIAAYLAHASIPDSTSLHADPLLNISGIPAEGSPCLSAGIKYWGNSARPSSINGEPRPDEGIDIGYYQTTLHEFHPNSILSSI